MRDRLIRRDSHDRRLIRRDSHDRGVDACYPRRSRTRQRSETSSGRRLGLSLTKRTVGS